MPVASADGIGGIPFGPAFVDPGGSDGGFGGSFAATISTVQGVCIAFDDSALEENPAWTRLDDPDGPWRVQSWSIRRGRTYEFDRTDTGTATIRMVDTTGDFDPVNGAAAYYGKTMPMKQAAIALRNPVANTWSTVFRGFVSEWRWRLHPTLQMMFIEIDLVDALELLAATQVVPGGEFGNDVPSTSTGDVYYEELSSPTASSVNCNAVQTRINKVLDDIGWPTGLREVFSGNVKLQETIYPAGTSALAVIQDAADAEFPGVSNVYVGKDGKVTFHGRLARFNPTQPQYNITTWTLVDDSIADSDASYARIVPPLDMHYDKEHVYTSAIATPQKINDGDIDGQYVADSTAEAMYGKRTWSAENLVTAGGSGTTAAAETLKFANYYKNNYATPRLRLSPLTVKAASTSDFNAAAVWGFVCGVDISDRVAVGSTHPNGGGLDNMFFVEGITYDVKPMTADHPEVTVTLDVSPADLYGSNPF